MATRQAYAPDRTPDEIERDIGHTRDDIQTTLEELGERLSPGQLLDQGLSYWRSSGAGAGTGAFLSNLGRTARDNPVPVTLAAAGILWLMASQPDHDGELEMELEGEHGTGERAAEMAGEAKHRIGEAAGAVQRQARHAGERLRHGGGHLRARGNRQAARARDGWNRLLDEQPLVLGLAGLVLGALVGGSLPPTETEDALMGEQRDEALSSAAEAGRERLGEAKRRVEEVARS